VFVKTYNHTLKMVNSAVRKLCVNKKTYEKGEMATQPPMGMAQLQGQSTLGAGEDVEPQGLCTAGEEQAHRATQEDSLVVGDVTHFPCDSQFYSQCSAEREERPHV
jgi:hypothetical protein